ncbi:MAG TPA: cupredoxin domain-containing protein [Candidatus Nitrosotalea sp.]|nr:cupredoxin domain-containing protein [Candidatus Nitrosotalea sp.]
MSESAKYNILLGVSIASIVIASAAIVFSLQNMQATNQNLIQANGQHYVGEKREFWLFNTELPDFNETKMGMPHDIYSMPVIAVFKGDKVVIHFFNTEEPGGDNHSFTIFDRPYGINAAISPGKNTTITFDANTTGIFSYYCTFHPPTMKGQLIVQQPPY